MFIHIVISQVYTVTPAGRMSEDRSTRPKTTSQGSGGRQRYGGARRRPRDDTPAPFDRQQLEAEEQIARQPYRQPLMPQQQRSQSYDDAPRERGTPLRGYSTRHPPPATAWVSESPRRRRRGARGNRPASPSPRRRQQAVAADDDDDEDGARGYSFEHVENPNYGEFGNDPRYFFGDQPYRSQSARRAPDERPMTFEEAAPSLDRKKRFRYRAPLTRRPATGKGANQCLLFLKVEGV